MFEFKTDTPKPRSYPRRRVSIWISHWIPAYAGMSEVGSRVGQQVNLNRLSHMCARRNAKC